jgi:hypothetical protein
MTLNRQKRWVLPALAVVLVFALGTFLWRALREPEFVYQGKPVRAWVRKAVVGYDHQARVTLDEARYTAGPVSKARIDNELVHCVMNSLNSTYNPLWKPYDLVRTRLPLAVAKVLPAWQDPRTVRESAVWWLYVEAINGRADLAPPGLFRRATPFLCYYAQNDRDKRTRQEATVALGWGGTFSPETLQIMFRALNGPDMENIQSGARWFARYPVDPERVVPLLVWGFDRPSTRHDCALALRAYGPRARFAVERFTTLARTNNWEISSLATSVLEGIDPEAAKKAGVK